MPSPFHTSVSLRGYHFEDAQFTFKLTAGMVAADEGKAVTLSSAAANTVRLADDNDVIIGRLEKVEDRTVEGTLVGTVALQFCQTLPIKTGETVVPGDTAVGAGSGEIKARRNAGDTANEADYSQNMVVEVSGSLATVVKV